MKTNSIFMCIAVAFLAALSMSYAQAVGTSQNNAELDACMAKVKTQFAKLRQSGASELTLRSVLEVGAARCSGMSEQDARAVGRMRAELGEAASAFLEGTLPPQKYWDFVRDRTAKFDRWIHEPRYRRALKKGDRDRDFVPDSLDRCGGTSKGSATDERGCAIDCDAILQQGHADAALLEACRKARATSQDNERFRALLEVPIPVDLNCEGGGLPDASQPLSWRGDDNQTFMVGRSTYQLDSRVFRVLRVDPGAAKCTMLYELEFRTESTMDATPVQYTRVLYTQKEDITPDDARVATFRLPFLEVIFTPVELPGQPDRIASSARFIELPGNRDLLQKRLLTSTNFSWRVKASNGNGVSRGWSEFRNDAVTEDKD